MGAGAPILDCFPHASPALSFQTSSAPHWAAPRLGSTSEVRSTVQSSLAQAGLVRACGAHGMWTRESVAAVSCDDSMGAKPAHGGTQEGKPSHGPSASRQPAVRQQAPLSCPLLSLGAFTATYVDAARPPSPPQRLSRARPHAHTMRRRASPRPCFHVLPPGALQAFHAPPMLHTSATKAFAGRMWPMC